MGSEMCIRDRLEVHPVVALGLLVRLLGEVGDQLVDAPVEVGGVPVSYTHLTLPTSDLV